MIWHVCCVDRIHSASLVFSATGFASAFSGLLAAAILGMDGIGGKPGWAWVFILASFDTCLALVDDLTLV